MKVIFTLCALAVAVFAGKDHYTTLTTYVSTTVCPVTVTSYQHGTTAVITKLTTSTITVTGSVTVTIPGPPVTTYVDTEVYTTYTSICPVTETKTLAGSTIFEVHSTVSTIIVKVPTTIYDYTSVLTTQYETTEIYATESWFETFFTTISAGSTIVITETLTSTIHITSAYTLTSTFEPPTTKATVFIPITLATSIPTIEVITVPSEVTETTQGGTIYSTVPIPSTSIVSPPSTTTTTFPTTVLTTPPPSNTSAPIQVSGNSAATNAPVAYAIVGAMAFFALA